MAGMGERVNNLVCTFDPQSPRTSAFHVHEWVHHKLGLQEDDIRALTIDGSKRKVYLKFVSEEKLYSVLRATGGALDYYHESGEVSSVTIEVAGMGVRKVRLANLSHEAPDAAIRAVLSAYGEVKGITEERWVRPYLFAVPNGIRIVELRLLKHVPSHVLILGQRVVVTYDGQPFTCFGCNEEGHQFRVCPHRRPRPPVGAARAATWAERVRFGAAPTEAPMDCATETSGGVHGTPGGETAPGPPVRAPTGVTEVAPVLAGGELHGVATDCAPPALVEQCLPVGVVGAGDGRAIPSSVVPPDAAVSGVSCGTVDELARGEGGSWADEMDMSSETGDEPHGAEEVDGVAPVRGKRKQRRRRSGNGAAGKVVSTASVTPPQAGKSLAPRSGVGSAPVRGGAAVEECSTPLDSLEAAVDEGMRPPPRQVSPVRSKKLRTDKDPPPTRSSSRTRSIFQL
jgi:hypothetical protein